MINPLVYTSKNGVSPVLKGSSPKIWFVSLRTQKLNGSLQRIRRIEELDVCSPKFSFLRAESEVEKQTCWMLCDMLDQKVSPGLGTLSKMRL